MDHRWRCMCGHENEAPQLYCSHCDKRRWSQLGVSRADAELLQEAILPDYLVRSA